MLFAIVYILGVLFAGTMSAYSLGLSHSHYGQHHGEYHPSTGQVMVHVTMPTVDGGLYDLLLPTFRRE